jgi:hypothetical protein
MWILQLVTQNIDSGVLRIASPILSRSYQQLGNGMVAFHKAMQVSDVPFPFPYAQVCDTCLIAHMMLTPFVTSVWVSNPVWSAVLCFAQIFVLWSLNFTAIEIENPYGQDTNDINGAKIQEQFNQQLCLLVSGATKRTPVLSRTFTVSHTEVSFGEQVAITSSFKRLGTRNVAHKAGCNSSESLEPEKQCSFAAAMQRRRSTTNEEDGPVSPMLEDHVAFPSESVLDINRDTRFRICLLPSTASPAGKCTATSTRDCLAPPSDPKSLRTATQGAVANGGDTNHDPDAKRSFAGAEQNDSDETTISLFLDDEHLIRISNSSEEGSVY